jgi:Fe-S oxidoreductase
VGHRFSQVDGAGKSQTGKGQGRTVGGQSAGHPDAVGKVATKVSPLANWANESGLHRQFMQSLLGIHKDKKLPPFASKTFASQFAAHRKVPQGEPAGKIAFFSTCYVNYNQPEIGLDTLEVMAHNNVDVVFAYERCCGMPLWHNGDMDGATQAARENVKDVLGFVNEGRTIVATNPTCSQMIRCGISAAARHE